MIRPRISIRTKVFLVMSTVLLLALACYVAMASSLFRRDKLAYVYDLNASLVETLSEQTEAYFAALRQIIAAYAVAPTAPSAAHTVFAIEPDVLRLRIFVRQDDGPPTLTVDTVNEPLLDEMGLSRRDLDADPVQAPWAALFAQPDTLLLTNVSLAPDAALLRIMMGVPTAANSVLVADVRPQRLLRLFGRSAHHTTFLVNENGQILAHPSADLMVSRASFIDHPMVQQSLSSPVQRAVKEFNLREEETLGAFSRSTFGRFVVLAQVPVATALHASRDLIFRSTVFGGVVILAAILASILFSRLLTAPIRSLRTATERIARGERDIRVDIQQRDEIGDLARAFETMSAALEETQRQLLQAEKLAAFGQLGAGITHEVKNPMTAIIGFAQLAQRRQEDPERLTELLQIIEREGKRCQDILLSFLEFAKVRPRSMSNLDLNQEVRDAAKLFQHQLGVHNIAVTLSLDPSVPPVHGNAGELHQVLLNLAINAQQAMASGGHLEIVTGTNDDGAAIIEVSDDGPGIPENIRARIFDPFFSTKLGEGGTGLGLSITFRIIHEHRGTIEVTSKPGEGATFTITLPPASAHSTIPTQPASNAESSTSSA